MGKSTRSGSRCISPSSFRRAFYLALAVCLPGLSHAQQQQPVSGMLTATAPVMIAATEVIPLTPNTPSQTQTPPGALSSTSPDALAPSPTTPLELPLPDAPTAGNGASPTSSGSTLAGQGQGDTQPSGKNVADIGTGRRFHYHFRLSVLGTYDDNIFLDEHDKRDDFFFIIQPGITLGFGDIDNHVDNFIRLDYSAGAFLYTHFDNEDTVQHILRLDGQYHINKLTLTGSQEVSILDGADITGTDSGGNQVSRVNLDVSGRTSLNIYTTSLGAHYELTGKTSVDLGFLYSLDDYDVLIDSQVISSDLYVNYAYNPKLTIGVGVSGGFINDQDPTPDETFEQANLRLTYLLTDKLSFIGTLGVDGHQSDGRNGTRVTPIFDFSALYLPFDGTTVGFTASRRVLSSAVDAGQNYQSSGFTISLRQRFLTRYSFSVSGGYENDRYVSVLQAVNATRVDDYFFIQTGVDVTLREHITAGITFQHRENFSSGNASTSFDDNQIGFRVSFNF